jgi:uncharacterized protein
VTIVTKYRPWYKEPYVWLLIAFPLAAVIGGIITAILAIQSDDGLVVDDYYKQGLEINRTLERDRLALHYELEANLQYAKGDEQVRLIINATNNFNYPDKLKISFLNASRDGMDKEVIVTRQGENIYLGPNPEPGKGKWHILVEGADWRLLNVLNIP